MTSNKLKTVACIAMVCDHIGYLLFPDLLILRYAGRLALPIFAFFIAEGCLHTRSRFKYFLQVFALAVICQLFYIGEMLIAGQITSLYLNILFTFSLSIIVCSAYLRLVNNLRSESRSKLATDIGLFVASLLLAGFCCFVVPRRMDIPVTVDYGIIGVLLPLSGLLFTDRKKNQISFSIGTVLYCIIYSLTVLPYTWYALLAIPFIAVYTGNRGAKNLKWLFYLFYPLHLALIYGISLIL